MNSFAIATLAAGALSAAMLGLAGAAAEAPSGPRSPTDTIRGLESQGYEVIVTTVSRGDPHGCSITAVRPGQTIVRPSGEVPIMHKTMYVDLRC
ncbi:hypothetical protein [Mycolicibacterium sp.]|uniref:hypothetical protein n=1 Tax=Mycolicibacterium sp. TaxID=2320850 RepID=UPI001A249AF3|nr:hypothetical protein [Mycolicibacterium sp.]MBJ7341541.1 hypothetical protein [Mycolicibacterium sp.]